ncbi:MAG: DUF202 domain-containing protein [Planctomycetes bacterium]|nr:DUF202 domain-containing protein [Planctomycetota bacterium]
MSNIAHEDTTKQGLNLGNLLAVDRTSLANQRTFLAYVRTTITLFGAGVTFIKFFDSIRAVAIFGWLLLPLAAITLAVGIFHFIMTRIRIGKCTRANGGA